MIDRPQNLLLPPVESSASMCERCNKNSQNQRILSRVVCTVLRCRWLIQDHLIQRPARLDTPRRSPRERLALARLAPRCRRCAVGAPIYAATQHPHTRSAPAVHLLWLVFNLLFPKMSTYTHTKSARIDSHVTAAEESALAVFFGQKN